MGVCPPARVTKSLTDSGADDHLASDAIAELATQCRLMRNERRVSFIDGLQVSRAQK